MTPFDHVARVLMMRGHRVQAIRFLQAVVARDVSQKGCAALLAAIQARPRDSVHGPEVPVSFDMVRGYVRAGWFREAEAVLDAGVVTDARAAGLHGEVLAALAPVPPGEEQEFAGVTRLTAHGSAAAALEILERAGKHVSPWVDARRRLLRAMLLDQGGPAGTADVPTLSPFGEALAGPLSSGDVPAAIAAAQRYCQEDPDDQAARSAVQALRRLWDTAQAEESSLPKDVHATTPMTVRQAALLQLRMGNLELAERMCRRALHGDPLNGWAQDRLADFEVVRMAMEGNTLSAPTNASAFEQPTRDVGGKRLRRSSRPLPKTTLRDQDARGLLSAPKAPKSPSSVSALLDKRSRPIQTGGHPYSRSSHPAPPESDHDERTVQGPPELHAELLLKQGFGERAASVYEQLVESYPDVSRYRDRLAEIRGFVSERQTSLPSPRSVRPGRPAAGEPARIHDDETVVSRSEIRDTTLEGWERPSYTSGATSDGDPAVRIHRIIVVA